MIAEIPTVSEYNIAVKKHTLEDFDDLLRFSFKLVASKVTGKFHKYLYEELINRAVASSVLKTDIANLVMNLAVDLNLLFLACRLRCETKR